MQRHDRIQGHTAKVWDEVPLYRRIVCPAVGVGFDKRFFVEFQAFGSPSGKKDPGMGLFPTTEEFQLILCLEFFRFSLGISAAPGAVEGLA